MMRPLYLHPDRLFPSNKPARDLARDLYLTVKDLPIVSPHGHTDPSWFSLNDNFSNAVELLIQPDHYIFRMLYSHGISLEQLGIAGENSVNVQQDARAIWRLFAEHYYLYRGTPSRMWLDSVFADVFGIDRVLDSDSADHCFDHINDQLATSAFKPRTLFERFNIEIIATTESALDELPHHKQLHSMGWGNKVITTYRPDAITDPEHEGFRANIDKLGTLTGEDILTWRGYLQAHKKRRQFFKSMGATATDHSHPTAKTMDLSQAECEALYKKVLSSDFTDCEAESFRAQMLTEMAGMSLEDELVMQLHCGPFRNHNLSLFEAQGRDKGADVPTACEYVFALRPLLNKYGSEKKLTIIVFTLDESTYSRELAPLAGHYPALRLGPAWWFHDSPEGMRRFRQQATETAGFYKTVGFNDDTRAFMSIPARHDMARRMDCSYLAEQVIDHRLQEYEAAELIMDLSYRLAKKAYKFG